ncbi:FAS1 domain-containing protein [Tothia fuscella]|uniref:FAS1 domain-containing protein n=1 Tax=Tothia fuscella TaxID=1048955 RepID=A0A9P4P0S5_9PEZI|nr:FAS1 domain-containing protein [Tothia fuscella]
MRFINILPLAVLGTAFVVPEERILAEIPIESRKKADSHEKKLPCPHHMLDNARGAWKASKNALNDALSFVEEKSSSVQSRFFEDGFDMESWLASGVEDDPHGPPHDHPPHHGPPGHGPPGHGPPGKKPHHDPPHHGPPHHGPPHHHKSNLTIYELISESKYTTKLAKIVDEDEDLVKLLNSTEANFTLFAPTDYAFDKIPEHAPKPDKEFIKKVILYHVSPGLYPAGRLLYSHTVPTLLNETLLGDNPQRLSARLGFRGVLINFYSKVVAVNIGASNGVIHGVDSLLIPPPKTLKIISLLPTEFSTLNLGLIKTGLLETLNSTAHEGGTFFAPSNFAFKKLGPRINGFLFSPIGEKYLKALLEYHVVSNQTLYSNTYYPPPSSESIDSLENNDVNVKSPGYIHLDLPTLLEDKNLAVDVARYGPFIEIKINGFTRVSVQDGIAKDGVIQAVSSVLIPPKSPGGSAGAKDLDFWNGEEMSVEEFKDRLGRFVEGEEQKEEDRKIDL